MDYYINPSAFASVFAIPSEIVERHLKLAKAEHIKVLLFIFKNIADNPTPSAIAAATGVAEYDVAEALLYWADAGILLPKNAPTNEKETEKTVVAQSLKPSRADVTKRGNEDPKIMYLLREAQVKLGRNLKSNEASTLVWLYDDQGLDVSLILLIIQYAVQHSKPNIRFIESVAVNWINKGIETVTQADNELKNMALGEEAWGVVCSAFGIEKRKPSTKETDLALKWVVEWNLSKAMLEMAYEECVNAKSKFNMGYTAKILENWHNSGFEKPEDIKPNKKNESKDDSPAFDLDLFQKMIDSKD